MHYEKPKRKRRPVSPRERINQIVLTVMFFCVVMAGLLIFAVDTPPPSRVTVAIPSSVPVPRIPFPDELPAITFPERVFQVSEISAFQPFVGFRAAWSPEGDALAAANLDGQVFVLELTDDLASVEPRSFSPFVSTVWGLDWSPDGRYIASSGTDQRITLWDAETGTQLWQRGLNSTISALAFVPQRELLSGIDYHSLVLWDYPEGTEIARSSRSLRVSTALDWTASGGRAVVSGLNDLEIYALDGQELISLGAYSLRDRGVSFGAVAWQPDGSALALADRNGVVWLWSPGGDPQNPPEARSILVHQEQVHSLAWSPDGRYLASASSDERVLIWDALREVPVAALDHGFTTYGLAWSPDGETLAVVDIRLRLWPTALWHVTIPAEPETLSTEGEGL